MGMHQGIATTYRAVVAVLQGLVATPATPQPETSEDVGVQFEKLPLVRRSYSTDLEGNLWRIETRGYPKTRERRDGFLITRRRPVGGVAQ